MRTVVAAGPTSQCSKAYPLSMHHEFVGVDGCGWGFAPLCTAVAVSVDDMSRQLL